MIEVFAIIISSVALVVSIYTAWRTLLQKGTVKMTQPTVIYFGPDGGENTPPKLFFRALLYCTAKSGRIVENMFVKIKRGESSQNFNIWVYGDDKLFRGSGLFVSENGVIFNHHFLLPKDGTQFDFYSSEYLIEVYAKLVGDKKPLLLLTEKLYLKEVHAFSMNRDKVGVYFDWGADSGKYNAHVDEKKTGELWK